MGIYGKAAVEAAYFARGGAMSPAVAWRRATAKLTAAMREKCCPKCAFLGLCQTGRVKGVDKGEFTASKSNMRYVVDAVAELKRDRHLADKKPALWKKVAPGTMHNSQMDVVIALWNEGLLR